MIKILYLKVLRILIAALKVVKLFFKEKVIYLFKRKPVIVFVVESKEHSYLVKIFIREHEAQQCCEGMEAYYKYKKIELT